MVEQKASAIDLTGFFESVQEGEWPCSIEVGGPSVVVYSKSQGWRDGGGDPGWPFMADGAGEQRVQRSWWDEATNTIVVILD